MPRKRVYTASQVSRQPTLLQKPPFDITLNGRVICTVVKPSGVWRPCENCGENTQNVQQYRTNTGSWDKLILCDKCANEIL